MALKGKKKSRVRGSQARRRPAAAPRPTYGGREKPRWYQTTAGMVIGFLVIASLIIFVWWFVADTRSESQALEDEQAALQTFTSDLRATITDLTPLTAELATAGSLKDGQLADKTEEWNEQLGEVQTALAQLAPPQDLASLTGVLSQSMVLYGQSIENYDSLPNLEGRARQTMSTAALSSFNAANNLFGVVIELLDQARSDAELSSSGLTPPSAEPAPVEEPASESTPGGDVSDEIQIPAGDEGDE
jgi:hypothetical protein